MTIQHLILIYSLENCIEELEAQQQSIVQLESHHGQFTSSWNHQLSENIDFKGVTLKYIYFEDPTNVEMWTRANMNHLSHGLFFDIISCSEFFGNESYVERNKTLNELYMSNKIGYGTKVDSIVVTSLQNILPVPYGKVRTVSSNVDVTAQA